MWILHEGQGQSQGLGGGQVCKSPACKNVVGCHNRDGGENTQGCLYVWDIILSPGPRDWGRWNDWKPEGTAHGPFSRPTHLDLLVEQLQGQVLKRHPGAGVEARLVEEVGHVSGIPGLAPRVHVLEGLEVIVERMPHHHLALQELEDL